MPAYTILFMRRDVTDRRPLTLHIGKGVFWGFVLLAISLPIVGFMVSAGFVAPAWLKLNFNSMRQQVESANKIVDPLKQKNATLASDNQRLQAVLQTERAKRAEIEARVTMAETARAEAANRLTQLEAEAINMRRSLAEYEQLIKPKLAKTLLECSQFSLSYNNNTLSYEAVLAKTGKSNIPTTLSVQVAARSGNNAVDLTAQQGTMGAQHTLRMAQSPRVKGSIAVTLPADTTRMAQLWVKDGAQTVGYCWKSF